MKKSNKMLRNILLKESLGGNRQELFLISQKRKALKDILEEGNVCGNQYGERNENKGLFPNNLYKS